MKNLTKALMLPILGLAAAGCQGEQAMAPPPKPPLVKVSLPSKDTVSDFEDFTGRTDAIYSVTVNARVTGYLDKVNFVDGTEVNEGELLFQIDPRPYKAELDRTEANVLQSEAHLRRLEADQRRAMNLFSRGAISREEIDRIAGDFAEAQAAVGVARAARDLAKLSLEFTQVKAPIAGRLSRRMVDPGNLVRADETALTSIVSLDPLFVYFDIDERTMLRLRRLVREGKVKAREQAVLPVRGELADEDDFPHQGEIDFSDNKVDPSTGTLRVRGKIANPKPRVLSPGLFMRVRLPVGDPHPAILIPEEALGSDQGRKYVYVVKNVAEEVKNKETGKAEQTGKMVDLPFKREVKVGLLSNGLRVIESGLDQADRVIVSGLQSVREKRPVKVEMLQTKTRPTPATAIAGE
jgi:multidrug efflux system membrane fusion protein